MQVALLDGKKRNFRLTERIRAGIGYPEQSSDHRDSEMWLETYLFLDCGSVPPLENDFLKLVGLHSHLFILFSESFFPFVAILLKCSWDS